MNNKVILIGLLGASALTYLLYYLNNKKINKSSSPNIYNSDIIFSEENPDNEAALLAAKLVKSAAEKYAAQNREIQASFDLKTDMYVEAEKKDPAFYNTNIIPDRIFIDGIEQPRGLLYE